MVLFADELVIHQFQVRKHIFSSHHLCSYFRKIPKSTKILIPNVLGSGAYAENGIGAASATGDGDVMMRFLPSFVAIENLRLGASPTKAARLAIQRIQKFHPKFFGGIIVMNAKGEYGAACNGMDNFPFSVGSENGGVRVESVPCNTSTLDD